VRGKTVVLCRWYWRASAALVGVGLGLTATHFRVDDPWLLVGLTMVLIGGTVANSGYIAMRARSMDEEFEAGYRVGYRMGRRAPRLGVASEVTPIRRVPDGLSAFSKAIQNGGIPKAPFGAVAGDRENARRAQAYPH
jgi:hypothetical protein